VSIAVGLGVIEACDLLGVTGQLSLPASMSGTPHNQAGRRARPRLSSISAASAVSRVTNASMSLALSCSTGNDPSLRRTRNSSTRDWLSAVMNDCGHVSMPIVLRAQTIRAGPCRSLGSHPQRRLSSRPDFRQLSHFQPAWLENSKWKATISFFGLPRSARFALARRPPPRGKVLPDRIQSACLV
jgi:hypothetical protein